VYSSEFKAYSLAYYKNAIKTGKIHVNKKIVDLQYKLRGTDRIVHEVLRQETPVLEELPTILHEDENFIAVNKPSSLPVHPCGNFCFNTLHKLLELEMGYKNLNTVHRLDR